MIRKLSLLFTSVILASFGIVTTGTPAIASVPLHTDMESSRSDSGSMWVGAKYHIGNSTMKACEMAMINERSDHETHSVRMEVYRPSTGGVFFSTVIASVQYGKEVGPLGHMMDLVPINTSGIAVRVKWGDSPVWHIVKSDRSQSEVTNTLFAFGSFPCP